MDKKIIIEKRTIRIFGHSTSISLEQIFWNYLNLIAKKENKSLTKLIEEIDLERIGNLSSTLRVFIFTYMLNNKL
ncbi:ribbon-helix-helix domain-containing protein [Rickettsiales bacterium LUAb2]